MGVFIFNSWAGREAWGVSDTKPHKPQRSNS